MPPSRVAGQGQEKVKGSIEAGIRRGVVRIRFVRPRCPRAAADAAGRACGRHGQDARRAAAACRSEGRLVDRQTFNAQLWPEVIVEDRNLTVHISALRKALGSDCIETVAKNGYRLAMPIRVVNGRAVNGQASSESLQVQREARYQLSQAERVPALKALGLFERALAIDANDANALAGPRLDLSAAVVDDDSPAAAGRRGGAAGNRSRATRAGDRQSSGRSLRRARPPEDDL